MQHSYFLSLKYLLLALSLTGCAAFPKYSFVKVKIAPDTSVSLPTPAQLGRTISAQQLITANWKGKTQSLSVHLKAFKDNVILIGLTTWGNRIFTLKYSKEDLKEESITAIDALLPDGEKVLLNMMLALWPEASWKAPLTRIGWNLVDSENNRVLFDNKGEIVIKITYSEPLELGRTPRLITINHTRDKYQLVINTVN